jgi:hypothetical protein
MGIASDFVLIVFAGLMLLLTVPDQSTVRLIAERAKRFNPAIWVIAVRHEQVTFST